MAHEYVRRIYDELGGKPMDRQLLDRFADKIRGQGTACDMGCGPGQIARYLQQKGLAQIVGVDLSPAMLQRARTLNPGIEFLQDNMLALSVPDNSWAGIAAFYAIVNFPPGDLPTVFSEMFRVLRPGGLLLLSFHIGDQMIHLDEMWGLKVNIDFYYFPTQSVESHLQSAGFEWVETIEREPYSPDIEHPSRRAYIFAVKPTAK